MHNNHSSLHSKFTKKIIWMSSEREFSSNITPRMHARNVEIHRTPFQHAPRIDQTVRRWMQNIASDWHYFFPPLPFPFLSFFLFLSRKKRMYRARGKINHLAWLFKLARWNCRFRRWFRVSTDFHCEKSRHPLLRSLPLVILTLSRGR